MPPRLGWLLRTSNPGRLVPLGRVPDRAATCLPVTFLILCAAAFPFLVPLARQVRFATERWADEAAAAAIGSRRTLARAIARVALMPRDGHLSPALAFSGRGTSARVDALLHPGDPRRFELPAAVMRDLPSA